jgi:hypothetical protein
MAEGPTDGQRPCAQVGRKGELSLVRALPLYAYIPQKLKMNIVSFYHVHKLWIFDQ